VNPSLPEEAIAFGESAARAFGARGGVEIARRAETDPALRASEVGALLQALGAADLDPREDMDAAAAAAELCRAAGRVVLPYPLVSTLLADADRTRPFVLVADPGRARVDHGDLFDDWIVATIDGSTHQARADGPRLGSRLGPFVADLRVGASEGGAKPRGNHAEVQLALTLGGWQILGSVEHALELAIEHVKGRVQFGQPIANFQAVQFQLADAAVAVAGLRELCLFTLWRVFQAPGSGAADGLALRVHALDVARSVLRVSQQLHGAAGVCDEYDISVLCRHVQPALRLPFGSERAVEELARAIEATGFDSLFPHGGLRL
jgi:hypothetical protein